MNNFKAFILDKCFLYLFFIDNFGIINVGGKFMYTKINEACDYIQSIYNEPIDIAIILGSGRSSC